MKCKYSPFRLYNQDVPPGIYFRFYGCEDSEDGYTFAQDREAYIYERVNDDLNMVVPNEEYDNKDWFLDVRSYLIKVKQLFKEVTLETKEKEDVSLIPQEVTEDHSHE